MAEQINIKDLTIEQLKAMVYDESVRIQVGQKNIEELNKAIGEKYDNLQKQKGGQKPEVVQPLEVPNNGDRGGQDRTAKYPGRRSKTDEVR